MEKSVASKITEIRLRRNSYMLVVIKNTSYFVDYNGDLYENFQNHCVKVNEEDFDKVFMSMCGYSFHSKTEELKNGYLTLDCGARIGVASTAVYDNDSFVSVKNISSLNIRIPREVKSCAKDVVNWLYVNSFPSIIVAGKPNSGKTTLLRDISATVKPLISSSESKTLGEAEFVDATAQTEVKKENEYFSSARLDRQTARDEAIEKLQKILDDDNSTAEAKNVASQGISNISNYISIENKIETLVTAKGADNCIAVINEDGQRVDVIVDVPELTDNIILQIKEIAMQQLGCSFENVSIIQSKS